MHRFLLHSICFLGLLLVWSCNPAKYVVDGDYMLQDNVIMVEERGSIDRAELRNYIKQSPNKRIIFWRFYLSLYNLSNKNKDNGLNNWLRKIGEPPVLYSETLQEKSADQLSLYLENKGFFNAEVVDSARFRGKKAKVYYMIKQGTPYTIRDINYFFHDAGLSSFVLNDTASSYIKRGEHYDTDNLQSERIRIEALLRNNGYFNFSRDYIYYEIDSSLNSHRVDVTVGIRNFPETDPSGRIRHVDHRVYHVKDVFMTADAESFSGGRTGTETAAGVDTILYDGLYVIYVGEPNVRPGVITQKNYIIPGDLYNAENAMRTYRNLSTLSAFSMVDISFREDERIDTLLNCEIRIVPATKQSYTVELEGTNSGGNIGAAGNLIYQHKNLFGGSEQFDLRFKGAIETLREVNEAGYGNMVEFGVEGRIRFPQFLLPFKTEQFIRRYNPQTNLSLSYNYQRRPDYSRTIANTSFGYNWRASDRMSHLVYPFEASLILTPFKSAEFQDWLEGKYLFYSYQPHFILDQRYSFIFSNQNLQKSQDFQYLRIDAEAAGNLMYAGYSVFGTPSESGNYKIFGVDFSQYVKGEIDFRNFNYLDEGISFVYRTYIGVGVPYLNSAAMPFEKQFFSGGANSVRAWQVKNLGPGSYNDTISRGFPNQTGDLKLEANFEYRFKLIWKIESALFLDVGNIWSLALGDDREGALFKLNRFYREFAIGTGIGARLDFNFFIFRFDLGIPLRSPFPVEQSNWLPGNAGIKGNDLTFNIAIGYPF
ncbi:MAG: BamA/TamA family outer membrane protein [Bacteroidales bacterium]|nr:BamA/TamA family outer membrane protein [Bacteroidales bacterium]MBN2697761.1 BamA/TamA family outer membrane protein [Bacteroidales bacterium]